jgi:enamine deaminase RidA (YjgF/YER057c/UK114 family)
VVRAGELVFPSGFMPRTLGSSDFDALAHPAQAQALAVLSYADRICKDGGNIVRAQWFMSDVRDFAGVQLAWSKRQGNAPHPFVCVQVPAPLGAPGAALTADFWIYAP